jgi:hypothetical protein
VAAEREQIPAEELARALEEYLVGHPRAVVLEGGKALFHFHLGNLSSPGGAKYALSVQGGGRGHCVLQVWSEERNIVRRVTGMRARKQSLLLETARLGQSKAGSLELTDGGEQRIPSERKIERGRFKQMLERALLRHWPESRLVGLTAAPDLEHSFGPAFVRGELVRGRSAMAVVAVGPEEFPETVDAALTAGILWLDQLRIRAGDKKLVEGLRLVLPAGMTAVTAARLAWLDVTQAKWELFELDPRTEELTPVAPDAGGNLATRLLRAPQEERVRARFATEIAHIKEVVPESEARVASSTEVIFALHGLVFARARINAEAGSFAQSQTIVFGAGANETELTPQSDELFRSLLGRLREERVATGRIASPLYRMQSEAWLESRLRASLPQIDSELEPEPVYSQMAAFAGVQDRGMLDMLARTRDGELAVIEVKAQEDMQLALQGLDYWMRVRQLHVTTNPGNADESEFTRMGYFPGCQLSREDPVLYLVAPALRIHPATEAVLKYFSPRVPWTLIAVGERWRQEVSVVWRKRSSVREPSV